MMIQAITVFLALIGTTLSCMSTGARVTYAMGRDEEVPSHFGMLHGKNADAPPGHLDPGNHLRRPRHLCLLLLPVRTGCHVLAGQQPLRCDEGRSLVQVRRFGMTKAAQIPNSLLIVTLLSNFGTFLLYMMTCIVAIVAFREHHSFHGFKHVVIPVFGLLANLGCMLFYLVGPFTVPGMSWHEPFIALGLAALWGIWGLIYFMLRSKKLGKAALITTPQAVTA